jgi:putative membrane protein
MLYTLFRYLHFLAIFVFAGSLIIENMAIKPTINGEDARNLAKVDAVYGISATLVFGMGLALWLWIGKPSEYYTSNPVFQGKIFLFIIIALVSVYPSAFFIKQRKSQSESIEVPRLIPILLKIEMILLLLIPILAYLATRGIGS